MSNKRSWPRITVAELIETGEAVTKTGPFGTQLKASHYTDTGTPVINVRNIGFGVIQPDKLEYLPPETVERLSTHLLGEGDIVFGRKGAVERHVLIRSEQDRWFQGSDCLRLRLNTRRLLPQFVSYFLLTDHHKQWMINQCSHGATMASLNQEIISRITLPLPAPAVQKRIVGILSAYDDLIENNTRRIAVLEEMAQLLYREWFVRFRFPGHEQARFIETEQGRVPDGWFRHLGDIITLKRGYDLPERDRVPGDIPIVSSSGITGWHHEAMATAPGVVTGRYGTLGEAFLIQQDFWPLNTTLYVQDFKGNDPILICRLLRSLNLGRHNTAGAVPGVNRNALHMLEVAFPTTDYQQRVKPFLSDNERMQASLRKKNENLRQTRDLLLPKLISGELDVAHLDIDTGDPLPEVTA